MKVVKVKCSYGVPISNPVARKSFTFRSKNNNKTQRNVIFFSGDRVWNWYDIIALYFSCYTLSNSFCQGIFLGNVAISLIMFPSIYNLHSIKYLQVYKQKLQMRIKKSLALLHYCYILCRIMDKATECTEDQFGLVCIRADI